MDRLCASTESGRLQFYVIGPRDGQENDCEMYACDIVPGKGANSTRDDNIDMVDSAVQNGKIFYLGEMTNVA